MLNFTRRILSTAVFWSFLTTGLRFGGVLLVLPIVLRTVPQEQLGLYYVFQTLAIFAVLLDIGIAPTISRSVSFLWAGAKSIEVAGHSQADSSTEPNWDMLQRVYSTFYRFYWVAAVALLLILGVGCLPYIWHVTKDLSNPDQGRAIWILLSVGSAWNFAGTIWPAMLGGVNRVREQQIVQLLAIGSGYVVTVVGLLMGFQLWAMAASILVQATVQRQCPRRILTAVLAGKLDAGSKVVDWSLFRTLWPSAWKTGVIGLMVTFYLSTPVFVASTFLGLDVAAQIGLSVQLAMTVCQIASVAMIVKVPMLSILRVNGNIVALRRIFFSRLFVYVALFALGSGALLAIGDWLLHSVVKSKTPFPPTEILILVFLFIGLEGLQSMFRGLALSANVTSFWRWIALGTALSVSAAWLASSHGIFALLVTLTTAKLFFIDGPIILAGVGCLAVAPKRPPNTQIVR